jgi:uncharacterized protein
MNIRTSPLVEMTAEAKRPSRWWLAWIVAVVCIVGGTSAGNVVGLAILGNPGQKDAKYQFIEFFAFGAALLVLFLWVRFKEGRPFSSIGFRGKNPIGKLLLGLVIGAVMMTIGVLVPWALGQYATGASEHTNVGSAALVPLLGLFFVFIWQASTEEAITRGYMLQTTGQQTNAWFAILGTSIFFAVVHLDFSPVPLLNITLYAVFASFIALGQGNLWLIAGIHAGWNFFQGNIYGIPVSGNAEANSLFSFGPAAGSNELLTGGKFGVEASLTGTIILGVAVVISFVYYRRREVARIAEAGASAVHV